VSIYLFEFRRKRDNKLLASHKHKKINFQVVILSSRVKNKEALYKWLCSSFRCRKQWRQHKSDDKKFSRRETQRPARMHRDFEDRPIFRSLISPVYYLTFLSDRVNSDHFLSFKSTWNEGTWLLPWLSTGGDENTSSTLPPSLKQRQKS